MQINRSKKFFFFFFALIVCTAWLHCMENQNGQQNEECASRSEDICFLCSSPVALETSLLPAPTTCHQECLISFLATLSDEVNPAAVLEDLLRDCDQLNGIAQREPEVTGIPEEHNQQAIRTIPLSKKQLRALANEYINTINHSQNNGIGASTQTNIPCHSGLAAPDSLFLATNNSQSQSISMFAASNSVISNNPTIYTINQPESNDPRNDHLPF